MEITTNFELENTPKTGRLSAKELFYVVYDACVINNVPSRDVAFIEQRSTANNDDNQLAYDEIFFKSLKEAKLYVKENFRSGAEYFSLNQSLDPDNFFYLIIDKIKYLIA